MSGVPSMVQIKEVWERCVTEDHADAAKRELVDAIGFLRERLQLWCGDDGTETNERNV